MLRHRHLKIKPPYGCFVESFVFLKALVLDIYGFERSSACTVLSFPKIGIESGPNSELRILLHMNRGRRT